MGFLFGVVTLFVVVCIGFTAYELIEPYLASNYYEKDVLQYSSKPIPPPTSTSQHVSSSSSTILSSSMSSPSTPASTATAPTATLTTSTATTTDTSIAASSSVEPPSPEKFSAVFVPMRIPVTIDDRELFIDVDTQPSFDSIQQIVSTFLDQLISTQETNVDKSAKNTFLINGYILRHLRSVGVNIFNPVKTEILRLVINDQDYPLTVLRTAYPDSFDIFEEAISALCMEFADELGITAETHRDCIESISVQALPIARNPLPNSGTVNVQGTVYAEYHDVPIRFENIDARSIRVQLNRGLMPILNAAEIFVGEIVPDADDNILTRNVFVLSQYILSNLRASNLSIITKHKVSGELSKHTATISYNSTVKLPLEFDLSVEDENQRNSDAAAAFCIEFSLIMNLDASQLRDCIDGVVNISQKIDF